MKRLLPLALFLAALPAAAVDRALLELADPNVNFAVGVRVADLAESPLLKPLLDEAVESNDHAKVVFDALGPGFLSRLEEALIVGRAEPGETSAPTDALILVRGDFSDPSWVDVLCGAGCDDLEHGGVRIRKPQQDAENRGFAVIDPEYAAFGTVDKVAGALDRRGSADAGRYADALNEWVSDMGDSHLWVAAKGPFEMPAEAAENPMFGALSNGLEGFGFGLRVDQDLRLGLEVLADSDQNAQQLYSAVQGLTAMAALSAASQPEGQGQEMVKFLENLKLTHSAKRVSASLVIPGDELMKQVRAQMEKAASSGEIVIDGVEPASEQATAAEPAPAPERKSKGGITIHGLD